MAPLVRTLITILGLCTAALAVPTDPRDTLHDLPYQVPQASHCPQRPSRPWTRLRDAFIHTIWGPPPTHTGRVTGVQQPSSQPAAPSTLRARYGGDIVLRFTVKTEQEARALAGAADTLYLDIWESAEDWVDVRMAKDVVEPLLGLLPSSLHNAHSPLMHDLAQAIYESYPSSSISQPSGMPIKASQVFTPALSRGTSSDTVKELFFRDYQPLSVIMPWMRLMASLFPTHVQVINIGTSYEGRDIPAFRLGVRSADDTESSTTRQTILISGGFHAREWISTATTNYVAYSLITRYGKSPAVTRLLEEFDWVFIPTLNPDGYVYSWDHDRLWRKNRQQTNIRFCPGIDLDRSFGFEWNGDASSSNPCSESYAGDGPFQGVEAHRFAMWAKNETEQNNVHFAAFLDLHSYSQKILYPYSFSCDQTPPTLENLEELAMGMAKAIRLTHNHWYWVTSACEGSSVASRESAKDMWPRMELNGGSAIDWFYHELGVRYAYQLKLRDTGSYGFLLPSTDILPTGQETFNAALAIGRFLLSREDMAVQSDAAWDLEYMSPDLYRAVSTKQQPSEGFEFPDGAGEESEPEAMSTELRCRRRRR